MSAAQIIAGVSVASRGVRASLAVWAGAGCITLARRSLAQTTPIKLETGEAPVVPAPTWIERALEWSPWFGAWVGAGLGVLLLGAWGVRALAARRRGLSPEDRALHELARTVPVGIAMLTGVSEYEVPWDQISAAVVVTTLPVVALVLFAQRRIVEGLTAGGVKG